MNTDRISPLDGMTPNNINYLASLFKKTVTELEECDNKEKLDTAMIYCVPLQDIIRINHS